jgi:hypothetical protein
MDWLQACPDTRLAELKQSRSQAIQGAPNALSLLVQYVDVDHRGLDLLGHEQRECINSD